MANATTAIVLPASFKFDGTTSDLAQQFYRRSLAGDTADKLVLTNTTLPDIIQTRLTANGLQFDQLTGLLQRALVWDSGYAINQDTELVRIWTKKGVSMADIAVPKDVYMNSGCKAQTCAQPDGLAWFKSNECDPSPVEDMARCLADNFNGTIEISRGIWSTGGDDSAIPELAIKTHLWQGAPNETLAVSTIHTATPGTEPLTTDCGPGNKLVGVGSIVISCVSRVMLPTKEIPSTWQTPKQGSIVTQWLKEFSQKQQNVTTDGSSATAPAAVPGPGATTTTTPEATPAATTSGFNAVTLVPIILGVLVALGVVIWLCRRKKRAHHGAKGSEEVIHGAYGDYETPSAANSQAHTARTGTSTNSSVITNSIEGGDSTGPVLEILRSVRKRLAMDRLELSQFISTGAYGEVWIGHYNDQVVAIKRLLQKKQRSPEHIHDFALEIQLSASLHHPHIVSFIGVAWDNANLDTLCMVLEYLPCGDLQTYLRTQGDLLSWPREKIHMAIGMASAIVYMHARTPVLIHRDLKSRNVLLSNNLETKIIDFGVSKGKRDETMTAGVGTPFWTAPEVLEGTRYSEKSDIYSFGVMLTELDTCKMPYHDAIRADGEMLLQFQILNNVMTRGLRPSCSLECPARVKKAVSQCLEHDPAKRPTAVELLRMLEGQ